KKVMWSDESHFQLHHADGRVRIWQKQHESMHPTCMSTTFQAVGGSVMVWGMFSWHDLGPLILVEQRLNSTTYLSMVVDQVHPNMLMAYPNRDSFFQQDNASCHGAHIVQEWFQEHEGDFTLLRWPPQSPDLNPKLILAFTECAVFCKPL
uniref:Tc1-like transposase DDE domain-containing protein n=1 Tax=Myotis lucifugus TaxID=59463 RepID=G1Q3L6_MYOLU